MKKLVSILLALNCFSVNADERYAHEYSSDDGDEHGHQSEWRDSENRNQRRYSSPRYQQNYQQQPIQIYLSPNTQSFYPQDNQTREDNRWRQRREELQQIPQTPYFENQFNREDTHW